MYHAPPVQPTIRNTRQVSISVAMVMPEMGLEVEPISPVRRDDTVTKNAPRMTMSSAPSRFMCSDGAKHDQRQQHQDADADELQRQIPVAAIGAGRAGARGRHIAQAVPDASRRSAATERIRLMMPAVATAPAPI